MNDLRKTVFLCSNFLQVSVIFLQISIFYTFGYLYDVFVSLLFQKVHRQTFVYSLEYLIYIIYLCIYRLVNVGNFAMSHFWDIFYKKNYGSGILFRRNSHFVIQVSGLCTRKFILLNLRFDYLHSRIIHNYETTGGQVKDSYLLKSEYVQIRPVIIILIKMQNLSRVCFNLKFMLNKFQIIENVSREHVPSANITIARQYLCTRCYLHIIHSK